MARWLAVVGFALAIGCGRFHFEGAPGDSAPTDDVPADSARIKFVQIASDSQAGMFTELTVAYGGDITTGDLLVVPYSYGSAGPSAPVVTDTRGNVFTSLPLGTRGTSHQSLAYAIANSTGPDTVTVTFNGTTNGYLEMWVVEYDGRTTLDDSSFRGGDATAADTTARTTVTTTQANELVIGVVVGGGTLTTGAGFIGRSAQAGDVYEDLVVPIPTTLDVTGGLTAGNGWLATAASFR